MSRLDKLVYVNTVNMIVTIAEDEIRAKTGIRVRLMVVGEVPPHERDAKGMAAVIAHCLGMTTDDYGNRTRKPQWVHLRQLASYFIKRYYPEMALVDIGAIIGGYDHTTVISSIGAITKMLDSQDAIFYPKYEQCLQAVTQWIRE